MKRADAKRLAVAFGVLVVVAVPIAILSASSSDGGTARLLIAPASAEVVVSLDDPSVNTPGTTGGKQRVTVECLDANGRTVVKGEQDWPFSDDAGLGAGRPHAHQPVPPQQVAAIASCRLEGTDPKIEGKVGDGA